MNSPLDANSIIEGQLHSLLGEVAKAFDTDALGFSGPLVFGTDNVFRIVIEAHKKSDSRRELTIVLTTLGGVVEVVQRIVAIIRHHYDLVNFVIPDYAYSAGTILVMSGDTIYMDYFSRLGPIDPQIERGDRLVPALGYCERYQELISASGTRQLTDAELAVLISAFDQAELHQYEQARDLSVSLLEDWLPRYKFKNWDKTETKGETVTPEKKKERAKEIALALKDTKKWHSHAAGVSYGDYDLDWLIHSLRIGRVPVPGQADPVSRLCFRTSKAQAVVESFIQARQSMYIQVYTHKTTRAYEAQLRHVLALASEVVRQGESLPGPCPEPLRKALSGEPLSTEEYLCLDDFRLWSVLGEWAAAEKPNGNGLPERLARKAADLVGRRRPYRTLVLDSDEQKQEALKLEGHLDHSDSLARFYCYRDGYKDVPYKSIFYRPGKEDEEAGLRAIYFLDDNGRARPAEVQSDWIRAISEIPVEASRLFYDEREPTATEVLKEHSLLEA